jgi:hypothetical protein
MAQNPPIGLLRVERFLQYRDGDAEMTPKRRGKMGLSLVSRDEIREADPTDGGNVTPASDIPIASAEHIIDRTTPVNSIGNPEGRGRDVTLEVDSELAGAIVDLLRGFRNRRNDEEAPPAYEQGN